MTRDTVMTAPSELHRRRASGVPATPGREADLFASRRHLPEVTPLQKQQQLTADRHFLGSAKKRVVSAASSSYVPPPYVPPLEPAPVDGTGLGPSRAYTPTDLLTLGNEREPSPPPTGPSRLHTPRDNKALLHIADELAAPPGSYSPEDPRLMQTEIRMEWLGSRPRPETPADHDVFRGGSKGSPGEVPAADPKLFPTKSRATLCTPRDSLKSGATWRD